MEPTADMLEAEVKVGEPLKTYLIRRYNAGTAWAAIARDLGVSTVTLWSWRIRLGIRTRAK